MSQTEVPKFSKEMIQQWLFDDLMGQIEPDLVSTNRMVTVLTLRNLSEKGLEEKFKQYEKAILAFVQKWPAFIKNQMSQMDAMKKKYQSASRLNDDSVMQEIENDISDSVQ